MPRLRAAAVATLAALLAAAPAAAAPVPGAIPALCSTGYVGTNAQASADLSVVSAGDAVITGTLHVPRGRTPAAPAPVVLFTHGLGSNRTGLGPTNGLTRALLDAGYAVLSYDSRGHGDPYRTAQGDSRRDVLGQRTPRWSFGSPAHEVADARALVAAMRSCAVVARRGNDPLIGWVGGSNGGGVQLNTAGVEPSIDAIVPIDAWGDLNEDLMPRGVPKELGDRLYDASAPKAQLDPMLARWNTETTTTGSASAEVRAWFAERSTTTHAGAVAVPTLLLHRTNDTLFPWDSAIATWQALRARGVTVKHVAVCGTHGPIVAMPADSCPSATSGQAIDLRPQVVAWLDRHVKGLAVETGPAFEWQGPDFALRAAEGPYAPVRTSTLSALGTLTGPGGSGGDTASVAMPAPAGELGASALRRPVLEPGPAGCVPVLGRPRVTVRGQLTGERGYLFAELVDERLATGALRTANHVVTPQAIAGPGDFEVSFELLSVGWLVRPATNRLLLELSTGSGFFAEPRVAPFSVRLDEVAVELPAGPPLPC
jgi:ABC-2 type transport system ATP-binding protein